MAGVVVVAGASNVVLDEPTSDVLASVVDELASEVVPSVLDEGASPVLATVVVTVS